ncbi:MAG: Clp protease N-terminal domain-containing protein [Gemmatimonadaceae bacterium]
MPGRPYTTRTKRVLELADAASESFGHEYIGTEHLLIGLLEEKDGIAAQMLNSFGVTTDKVKDLALEIFSRR